MENTLIEILLGGFPSFAGLLICIVVLMRLLDRAEKRNDKLTEAIIRGENCPDESQAPDGAKIIYRDK